VDGVAHWHVGSPVVAKLAGHVVAAGELDGLAGSEQHCQCLGPSTGWAAQEETPGVLTHELLGHQSLVQSLQKAEVVCVSGEVTPASLGKHERSACLLEVVYEHTTAMTSLDHAGAEGHEGKRFK
jgi:hypothetical protein